MLKRIGRGIKLYENVENAFARRIEYPFQEYIYPGLFKEVNLGINKVATTEEERHIREGNYKNWKQDQINIIEDNKKLPELEEELNKLKLDNYQTKLIDEMISDSPDPRLATEAQRRLSEGQQREKKIEEMIAKLKVSQKRPFPIEQFDPNRGTMDDLYNHFCQPYGDYYQVKNNISNQFQDTQQYKDSGIKNPYIYSTNRNNDIREDGYEKMRFVPKDAIFMTFNIIDSGRLNALQATRTGNAQAFAKPYFIGPRHILDRLVKIFNVNSEQDERSRVKKLYEILKTIQRMTFQNSKKYQKWMNGKPMKNNKPVELRDVCEDLYKRLLEPTNPVAAKSQFGFGMKEDMRAGAMREYTSVMLIGKRTDNPGDIKNLDPGKQKAVYCWLKNDDGRIIDGGYCNLESRPVDVELIITNGTAEKIKDHIEPLKPDSKDNEIFDIYKMQWAGFKLNRLVPGFGLDMYTEKEKDRNDLIRASRGDLGTGMNENWMRQGQGRIDSKFGATTYAFTDGGTRTRKSKRKSRRRKSRRRKSKKH